MKKILLLSALLVVAAVSCSKEENPAPMQRNLIQVTYNVNPGVKSSLSGNTISWSEGDAITYFDDKGVKGNATIVSGSATISIDATATTVWAVYPANEAATVDITTGTITTSQLSEQTAVAGSFGAGANLAVATGSATGSALDFKNACSYVKFTVPADGITEVSFSGAAFEKIAGAVTVNASTGDAVVDGVNGSATVTLKGSFVKDETYFIAVLKQNLSGVNFTFSKSDGTMAVKKGTAAVNLTRNTPVSFVGKFGDLSFNNDLYSAYEAGKVLKINGLIYSKATKGAGSLIKHSEYPDIQQSPIRNNNGVFFLDQEGGSDPFTQTTNTYLSVAADALIVSRYVDSPATVKPTNGSTFSFVNGSVTIKNIIFDFSEMTKRYFRYKLSEDMNTVNLDGCSFLSLAGSLINNDSAGFAVENHYITNCTFKFVTASVPVINLNATTVLNKYKNFVFNHNLFYSGAPLKMGSLISYKQNSIDYTQPDYSSAVWDTDVTCRYNIFYNLVCPNGWIHIFSVNSILMRDNIYDASVVYSESGSCVALYNPAQNKDNIKIRESYLNDNNLTLNAGGGSVVTGLSFKKMQKASAGAASPWTSAPNPASCSFPLTTGYADYGPQR